MTKMRSLGACVLALALASCASVNPNVATSSQVAAGINTYNIAVAGGRAYLASSQCTVKPPKALCQEVYSALVIARPAERQLLAALAANSAAPTTALQALSAAYAVFQQIPTAF
jgi:hypothetical protein